MLKERSVQLLMQKSGLWTDAVEVGLVTLVLCDSNDSNNHMGVLYNCSFLK